jgi:hypothetical protein
MCAEKRRRVEEIAFKSKATEKGIALFLRIAGYDHQ